jgi:hypothetical protein
MYSAFDRELFACFSGIRHFQYMLDSRCFAIFANHKPITYTLLQVSNPWMARQGAGSFHTWRSLHQASSTLMEHSVWWQTLSPGHQDTRQQWGLPRW